MAKNINKAQKKVKGEEDKKKVVEPVVDSDENSDEEEVVSKKALANKKQQKAAQKAVAKRQASSDEDSEGEQQQDSSSEEEQKPVQKKAAGKKQQESDEDSAASDSEEKESQDKPAATRGAQNGAQGLEVIVKGLSFQADENDIGNFLDEKFGPVSRVNLLKNDDGRSKGIAFITFETEEGCNSAIAGSNCDFMGRYLVIERTKPKGDRSNAPQGTVDEHSKTIFVGNLSFKIDAQVLKNFFSSCGVVVDARIAQQDGRSRGFGHVEFADKNGVEKALKKAGEEIDGRPIKVDVAATRGKDGGNSHGNNRGGNRGGRGGFGGGNRGGNRGGFGGNRGGRNDFGNERRGNISGYSGSVKSL